MNSYGFEYINQWESLYEMIKMMARMRATMTEPTIHLFLDILLDIAVNTFLLLSIASSTPWSCYTKSQKKIKHFSQWSNDRYHNPNRSDFWLIGITLEWAWRRVWRCWLRFSTTEIATSSVSSISLLLSLILSLDWSSLSIDIANLPLWSADTWGNHVKSALT